MKHSKTWLVICHKTSERVSRFLNSQKRQVSHQKKQRLNSTSWRDLSLLPQGNVFHPMAKMINFKTMVMMVK